MCNGFDKISQYFSKKSILTVSFNPDDSFSFGPVIRRTVVFILRPFRSTKIIKTFNL